LKAHSLAFTWCQVPFIYRLTDEAAPSLVIQRDTGEHQELSDTVLPPDVTSEISMRTGRIERVELTISRDMLFCS
jgi:hypothetical protein